MLVVLLAMVLHIVLHGATIRSLLPHGKEPDTALVHQVRAMLGEAERVDAGWAKYPHLLPRLMTLVPRPAGLDPRAGGGEQAELEAHLAFASRHLVVARLVVALLAALAIPLTLVLARHFLPEPWALVATLLLASSLLLQCFAHQARPHAALAAPVLVSLLACHAWARSGRHRDLALATLGCSLAMGTLHSGSFVLLGALTALVVRRRANPGMGWGPPLLALLALALSLCLSYPFLFEGPSTANETEMAFGSAAFPHVVSRERFNGGGFAHLATALRSYDPMLAIAGACGLLAILFGGARRSPGSGAGTEPGTAPTAKAVLVLPPLAYLLVLGLYGRTMERFLIPVLPFLAVLAAHGLGACARWTGSLCGPRAGRPLTAAIVTGTLALTTWPCLKLAWLHSRPDTFEEAARWITANVDREHELALIVPRLNLPLLLPTEPQAVRAPPDTPLHVHWTQYLARLPAGTLSSPLAPLRPFGPEGRLPRSAAQYPTQPQQALAILREVECDYLLLERGSPSAAGMRAAAENRGRLRHSISPWAEAQRSAFGLTYQSDTFRADVLGARNLGLVFDIWEL